VNILLIHQYFLEKDDPGGSRFNEMSRIWVEMGHHVTVVAGMLNYVTGKVPDKYTGLKYELSTYEPGLDVLRCHVSPSYYANFVGRLWAYFSFVWYGTLGCLFKLRGRKYDVIVATSPPLFIGLIAYIVSRLKKVPYVFEVRDLWPESAVDTGVLTNKMLIRFSYWLEKFIYRKAFLINVLTPAFRRNLMEKKGIAAEKIVFIPNACDFGLSDHLLQGFDSHELRLQLGWQNDFVVTYVGVHGVANHLIQLVDTAELVKDDSVRIVLIGGGAQKDDLKKEVANRKLDNVTFIDPVPKREVMKFILASDVGTSVLKKVDTFKTIYSNKTFDYMACQRPILMVIDGVSRELVEEAQCGLYAEPENASEIAKQIRELKKNSQRRETMGMNGYTFAKTRFDRNVLAKKYIHEIENRLKLVSKNV
jgi:glycosyltransferase involved in cell wall biosynthesis